MGEKALVLVAVVLCATLSGCNLYTTEREGWIVGPEVQDVTETESGYRLNVTFQLEGKTDSTTLYGLRMVFLTEQRQSLNVTEFGNTTVRSVPRDPFVVTLPTPPQYIDLRYDSLEPAAPESGVVGLRLTDGYDAEYYYVTYTNFTAEY